MRHIVRKISLEQFKSRMPGISPSYLGDGKYTFDKNNVSTYPYSNYGMFPKDINISGTCYSYNQLVDIYHKCEERDRLLSGGTCGRQYDSLTEFYRYEQGKSPLTYQECVDREVFYELYKDEYNVAQQLFPRYIIPLDYRDGWGCTYLYVSDVVRWIEWFERLEKVDKKDCCQEKEYIERGGKTMLASLQKWLGSMEYEFDTCEPFISVPLNITQSIDDLGEFSLMIDEWVPGRDYSAYSASTQVLYEDNVYKILGKGYEYDENNNTYEFSGSLITYTESPDTRTYSYNALGQRIDKPNDTNMAVKYTINTNNGLGYVVVKGKLIPIEKRDYININGTIYPLAYVDFNPYTVIDGVTYFGNYEEKGYTFTYNGEKYLRQESKAMVEYQHKYYLVNDDDTVIISTSKYYKIDGYITYKSEKLLIYNNNFVTISSSGPTAVTRFDFTYTIDSNVCNITEPYQVYSSDTISAYTESKLSSLETITDRVYDNMGNKLPGRYRIINGEYESIQNDGWLEFPYIPKTVAHLSKDDDSNFFGDLISKIEFYNESGDTESFSAKTDMVGVIKELKWDMIKCDITYHMGCVMGSNYEIVNEQSGITYIDTFTLVKKTCSYMVDNTNQYILNYFELEPEYIDYSGEQYLHPQRVMKSRIIYKPQLEDTNTTMNAPVMREEYKLGSSSLENIEANIYIDRGTSRSFDYHLKLFEVGSLEGLENYGNSWFRII